MANVHFLDEEPLQADGFQIDAIPYSLTADGPKETTGLVFRQAGDPLAIVADDARRLDEKQPPNDLDAVVLECGHFTHGPDGERIRDGVDLSPEEVRELIHRIDPDRAFLSHVSRHYGRSFDHFKDREREYDRIQLAHDGQTVRW